MKKRQIYVLLLRYLEKPEGRAAITALNDKYKLTTNMVHQLHMAFVNLTMDPTDPRVFERKFNQMVRQIKGNSTQGAG